MEKLDFVEPMAGCECAFAMLPLSSLAIGAYQRNLQPTHVSRLTHSIANGFVSALIVSEVEEDSYIIIDGQHRFAALKKNFPEKNPFVPCIIVPENFINLPLIYNIEKSDDIKAKATKIYHLYNDLATSGEEIFEKDIRSSLTGDYYLLNLAFSCVEEEVSALSIIEPAAKKIDNNPILDLPLSEAVNIRRTRGQLLGTLDAVISLIAETNEIKDFNLKAAICSRSLTACFDKKRNFDIPFDDAIDTLITYIKNANWSWMRGR